MEHETSLSEIKSILSNKKSFGDFFSILSSFVSLFYHFPLSNQVEVFTQNEVSLSKIQTYKPSFRIIP